MLVLPGLCWSLAFLSVSSETTTRWNVVSVARPDITRNNRRFRRAFNWTSHCQPVEPKDATIHLTPGYPVLPSFASAIISFHVFIGRCQQTTHSPVNSFIHSFNDESAFHCQRTDLKRLSGSFFFKKKTSHVFQSNETRPSTQFPPRIEWKIKKRPTNTRQSQQPSKKKEQHNGIFGFFFLWFSRHRLNPRPRTRRQQHQQQLSRQRDSSIGPMRRTRLFFFHWELNGFLWSFYRDRLLFFRVHVEETTTIGQRRRTGTASRATSPGTSITGFHRVI